MKYPEYAGMSYELASREAERLFLRNGWYQSFDRLTVLRYIMLASAGRMRDRHEYGQMFDCGVSLL